MSETKPRKRAKGGGRKPLDPKTRRKNRQASQDRYRDSKKQFSCMLEGATYDSLRNLRKRTGLTYDSLIAAMVRDWEVKSDN